MDVIHLGHANEPGDATDAIGAQPRPEGAAQLLPFMRRGAEPAAHRNVEGVPSKDVAVELRQACGIG